MKLARIFIALTLLALSACATSMVEPREEQFISKREMLGVSLVREGLSYYQRSRFTDAELKLRQAAYLYPDAKNIKSNLAVVLERQAIYGEAERLLRDLLKSEPDSLFFRSGLAHLYLSAERYKDAERTYLEAYDIAIDSNNAAQASVLARSLAVLYFRLGREEDARCYSENAMRLNPVLDETMRHVRLLMATHLNQPAGLILKEFSSKYADQIPAPIMHQLAMVSFAENNFEDSYRFEQRAFAVNKDPGIEFEMNLVRDLSKDKLDIGKEEQEDEEQEDEPQEDYRIKALDSLLSLYWPTNMLDMLESLREEEGDA